MSPSNEGDGRDALLGAVSRFSDSDRSPEAYRELAQEIERLAPRFNAVVAAEAERYLVFLALEPLSSHRDESPEEQLEALALTVWPTALGKPPKEGEDPWSYTERLCAEPLAETCKRVVPEYRAEVLSQHVWSQFKARAREAMAACDVCENDPKYTEAIKRFEERDRELSARAGTAVRKAHPKHWPIAGEHASEWTEVAVVTVREDGTASFEGEELVAGTWAETLAARRGEADTLGVWIPPSADVGRLRSLAKRAAPAGYRRLALQVRQGRYPYELAAYHIELGRGRKHAIPLRNEDSIQLLVSVLDAARAEDKPIPSL